MSIPKRLILRTTDDDDDGDLMDIIRRFRLLNPRWELTILFEETDRNFIKIYYPDYLQGYDSLKSGSCKGNLSTFLHLHKYGGLYHHSRLYPEKPYKKLVDECDKSGLILFGETNSIKWGHLMASVKKHDFWLEVANRYIDCIGNLDKHSKNYVTDLTFSHFFILHEISKKFNHVEIIKGFIYPYTSEDEIYHKNFIVEKIEPYYKPLSFFTPV